MAKRIAAADRDRYVLYFRGHRSPDVNPRTWVPVFFDPSVAKAMVLRFCGTDELERFHNVITLSNGMTLTCEQLDEVMAADETGVELNTDHARNVLRFKLGSWEEDHSKSEEIEQTTDTGEIIKVKKLKPEKPKRAVKPDSYITIGELCIQWDIKPLHARTCLRASDLVKPEYGWAFDPKDVPKIKKLCGVK